MNSSVNLYLDWILQSICIWKAVAFAQCQLNFSIVTEHAEIKNPLYNLSQIIEFAHFSYLVIRNQWSWCILLLCLVAPVFSPCRYELSNGLAHSLVVSLWLSTAGFSEFGWRPLLLVWHYLGCVVCLTPSQVLHLMSRGKLIIHLATNQEGITKMILGYELKSLYTRM